MPAILVVQDLSFSYQDAKTPALQGLSFEVQAGEFFCIVGPNGSGKSTLASALVGLIPHFFPGTMEGNVIVDGINTRNATVADLAMKIGLAFQNPFNQLSYTALTVAEELAYGLGNLGVAREDMRNRIREVADLVGITNLLDQNPLQLSGGQAQRVAIGSVMVMRPDILVLDECTSQLDPIGAETIFNIVKDLNSRGITVIMAEHDMERVAAYADRVLVLHESKRLLLGTPRQAFSDPRMAELDLPTPQYLQMSRELAARGLWNGEPALTIEESEAGLARVLPTRSAA